MASSSTETNPIAGIAPLLALKLTATNYLYWRQQMLPLLALQHLDQHVDGTISAPPKTVTVSEKTVDNPEYLSWLREEQRTIVQINASLTEEALSVVVGLTSAREIWLALENAFCNSSIERIQNIRDNLRLLQKGDKSVSEFGRLFKALCDQLHAIGHPVDPMDQLHWFLCGLGPNFETFSTSTSVRSVRPLLSFADLLARAESHELFVQALHRSSTPSVAFPAQQSQNRANRSTGSRDSSRFTAQNKNQHHHQSVNNRGPNRPSNQSSNRSRRPPTCQLCRTPGHYATQCAKLATFATSVTPSEEQLAHAFHAQCNFNSIIPDWTCDTGASDHMVPNHNSVPNSSPTQGQTNQECPSPREP
ncbi:putative RNA-directed DNA polymerase [Helianthus annuus]|nr:putative RNA-directed DNA polymerase [Helianthus annuus]